MSIRMRMSGPLIEYRDGYRAELARLGYTEYSILQHLTLVGQLSRFMAGRGLGIEALGDELLDDFVAARHDERLAACSTPRTLAPLLGYLRRLGLIPEALPAVAVSGVEERLGRWRQYLLCERGLVPASARGYTDLVRPLLVSRRESGLDLACLSAQDVVGYMLQRAGGLAPKTVQHLASALRSFLTWAFVTGLTPQDLTVAVPSAAYRSAPALPKFLQAAQVQAMLASCQRGSVIGARDFALITMLWRLGLRAGEAARLALDDVDWRSGQIVVLGKGNRHAQLPLPTDVGDALVAYLQRRPTGALDRSVFLRAHAPRRGMTAGGVTQAVAAASVRCGFGALYAHRLRHSAATGMLAGGASLAEIGQVLRHQSATATAVYAAVDLNALGALARPWNGTAG